MSRNLIYGLLTLLIAALLLIPGLADFSFWYDEVAFVEAATSLHTVGDLYEFDQNARIVHPPLAFIIYKAWMVVAGSADFSLRAFTVFIGLLTVAFTYKIGTIVGSPPAGFGAGIILASMGFFQQYTHTTYNYALFPLLSAIFIYFFARYWLMAPNNTNLMGVVLATSGLAYTHYYSLFLIISLNLITPLLWLAGRQFQEVAIQIPRSRRMNRWTPRGASLQKIRGGDVQRRALKKWGMGQITAAILYIPWIPALVKLSQGVYRTTEQDGVSGLSINADADGLKILFELLLYDGLAIYLLLGVVGLLLLAFNNRSGDIGKRTAWILSLQKTRFGRDAIYGVHRELYPASVVEDDRRFLLILVTSVVGSLALAFIAHRIEPTLTARRLIFLLVGIAVAGGVTFRYLPRPAIIILAAAIIFLTPDHPMPTPVGADWQYRDGIKYIQQRSTEGDFVYIDSDVTDGLIGRPLNYYAERLLTIPVHVRGQPVGRLLQAAWVRDRLWLVWSPERRSLDEILAPMESEGKIYREVEREDFPNFSVSRLEVTYPSWIPPTAARTDNLQLPQDFGGIVQLVDYGITTEADTGLTLWLQWMPVRGTTEDYALYIHLHDEDGALAAQWDSLVHHLGRDTYTSSWGAGNTILDSHELLLPQNLPSGEYILRIGLYVPQGARLMVTPGDGTGQQDGLRIAEIPVR